MQDTLRSLKTKAHTFEKLAQTNSVGLKTDIGQLLALGISPNFQIDGTTLLRWTIKNDDEDAMDYVIEKGADVNGIYRTYSALQTAMQTPVLAIKLLKKYNADPATCLGSPIFSPYSKRKEHHAACKKLIKVLVKKGLSANFCMDFMVSVSGKYAHPLLYEAIRLAEFDKKSDLVEFLLKKGAKVSNERYWNGFEYHTLFEYARNLPEILNLLKSHEESTEKEI